MKSIFRKIWPILLLTIVSGCAASYGPYRGGPVLYGYKDTPMGKDTFLVSFTDYALYEANLNLNKRASELCNGREFELQNIRSENKSGPRVEAVAEVHCQ